MRHAATIAILLSSTAFAQGPADAPLFVRMETDHPDLQLIEVAEAGRYKQVCSAPCEQWVQPSSRFVLAGKDLPPSEEFSLPTSGAAVSLVADAGSQVQRQVGIGLSVLGSVFSVLGVTQLATTAAVRAVSDAPPPTLAAEAQPPAARAAPGPSLFTDGIFFSVSGAALALPGLWLMLTSGTSFELKETQPPSGASD
jgi:hypothetical protein